MLRIDFDVNIWYVFTISIISFVALLYICWDVNYFIRVFYTIGVGKLFHRKYKIDETTSIFGVCTTNDVDVFLKHMNNARYVRELDFARFHFYERTGLYSEIVKAKATALQSASFIRYRRTIPIFTAYNVTTKLIYWDEKVLYIEQQFVTVGDNFVRATVISKQNIIGMNVHEVICKMLNKDPSEKPELPLEIQHLCECIDISSAKIRKRD